MREGPSEELSDFLERTGLASTDDLSSAAGRARRLVGSLPMFDSVWVDALVQDHCLTPYQASQINAGLATALEVGPYVLRRRLATYPLGRVFEADEITKRQRVRLFVVEVAEADVAVIEQRASALVERSQKLDADSFLGVEATGIDPKGRRPQFWAASQPVDGMIASEWLIPHGRLPVVVVLEIARQMAVALAKLEPTEFWHADISTAAVVLTDAGNVVLPMPGLRAVLRSEEGYGHADLAPEAYDTLAVERLLEGTGPTVSSELFACGALWWHLLTGRPPMPGGDSIAKQRNVQKSKIPSVREWVPDVPEVLEAAIERCTQRSPADRGSSFADLARHLGPSTRADRAAIAACVRRHRYPSRSAREMPSARRFALSRPNGLLAASVIVAFLAAGTWFLGRPSRNAPTVSIEGPARTVPEVERPERVTDLPMAGTPVATEPSRPPAVAGRIESNVIHFSAEDSAEGRFPRLRPGATLRGDPDARPRIEVPPEGLLIALPHLRFENIDFVWRHASTPESDESPAMLVVRSGWVEFHQCSFQTADLPFGTPQPAAIATVQAADETMHPAASRSIRVIADACVFRGVAAGIDVRSSVPVAIDSDRSLFLGPGPFLRLQFAPVIDRPVSIALSRFTLRGATALLECRYDSLPASLGKLSIKVKHAVLAPQVGGAVLRFEGAETPTPLLEISTWTGEGSLLSLATPIAQWHDPAGRTDPIPEPILSMDGITRSRFQFVSPQMHLPESSAIERVSAPLRGERLPGIDANRLRLPSVATRKPR